ncbi:hypothetical protein ScPMuIL_015993 [Solemya velum]
MGVELDIVAEADFCDLGTRCAGMGGMEYSVCSSTCGKSCRDLHSQHPRCDSECVPGCVCPEGQYLTDGPSPACVEIEDCTCFDEYAPRNSTMRVTSL